MAIKTSLQYLCCQGHKNTNLYHFSNAKFDNIYLIKYCTQANTPLDRQQSQNLVIGELKLNLEQQLKPIAQGIKDQEFAIV